MTRKCQKNGCGAAPLRDGPFCLMHDPERANEVAAARSRRRPKELDNITTPEDAQRFLATCIQKVAAGQMSASKLDQLRRTVNTMFGLSEELKERKTDEAREAREAVSEPLPDDWMQKAMARHLDPEKCQEYIDKGVLTAEEVAEGQRLDALENARHEALQHGYGCYDPPKPAEKPRPIQQTPPLLPEKPPFGPPDPPAPDVIEERIRQERARLQQVLGVQQ